MRFSNYIKLALMCAVASPSTAFGVGSEFTDTIIACDNAWSIIGYAGIGVTAVNVNLFHDANGNYGTIVGGNFFGYPIGWAGCMKSTTTNICSTLYNGRVIVADNKYFYPTVPDRTLPPTPNVPAGNLQYATDVMDILVGHETGHALGLPHRAGVANLMKPTLLGTNIGLDNSEISIIRSSALNVFGLEINPSNQIDPGNFVGMTLVNINKVDPKFDLKHYQLLDSINAALDKQKNIVHISLGLRASLPKNAKDMKLFLALETKDGKGLNAGQANRIIGFPTQITGHEEFDAFFELA
ncbi:MAG: hypothetical protein HRU28_08370 [Rhizobiales bacterium]|nr:hypothetical protein [Hyphomicrobiales bacterium]